MEKLSEALASNIERLSNQIAAMGPDAQRIYEEMVSRVVIGGWFWLAASGLLFVASLAFLLLSFKREVREDGPVLTLTMLMFCFMLASTWGAMRNGAVDVLTPEAALIEKLVGNTD